MSTQPVVQNDTVYDMCFRVLLVSELNDSELNQASVRQLNSKGMLQTLTSQKLNTIEPVSAKRSDHYCRKLRTAPYTKRR